MKLLIAGGRDYNNEDQFNLVMQDFLRWNELPTEVVSGGAKGADSLGERWGIKNRIVVKIFEADWDKHGKSAGPLRNKEMAAYCDKAYLFWDAFSKGTKNMIEELQAAGKPYRVIYY